MGNVPVAPLAPDANCALERARRRIGAASAFDRATSDRTRRLVRESESRWADDQTRAEEGEAGFICPDCLERHADADALAAHFARAHGEMARLSGASTDALARRTSAADGQRHTITLDGVTFNTSEIVVEGWMTKQGHFMRNWKRRYFTLTHETLWYTSSPPHIRSIAAATEDWDLSEWVDVFAEDSVTGSAAAAAAQPDAAAMYNNNCRDPLELARSNRAAWPHGKGMIQHALAPRAHVTWTVFQ